MTIHTIKLNNKPTSPLLEIDTEAHRYRIIYPNGNSFYFSLSRVKFDDLTAEEARQLRFQLPLIQIAQRYLLERLGSSEPTKQGEPSWPNPRK
jgi:hypothetical protein